MDLSRLNFGAPSAERDIELGLADYFVETEAFRRVAERKKTIVLGNRGSGKSAIFKILARQARFSGANVLELSPEDYSYEMLSSTMQSESRGAWAKYGAYSAAWKYLIWVLIMKSLTTTGPRLKTGDAAKIYTYIRDSHAMIDRNPIAVLISYLKRIEGLKIGTVEVKLKTTELAKLYKLEEIHQLLPALRNVCARRKIFVFVDELDRGWDSSEDARAFVAGLFQACVSINEQIENVTIYVSLRRELYDSIPELYDDAQKYRDIVETITWDEPALLSLMSKRIRHGIPELSKYDDEICWHSVFSETLQYRQTKSFNYIVDRTLYRPREIIQLCSDALKAAQDINSFPIDYDLISRAELAYSEDRAKDIAAEYRFQYPGLLSIFEVFRGLTYTFDREDLELLCLAITTGEYRIDGVAEPWVSRQDYEFLIEILWRVGFLRAQAVGGVKALRRSGSTYLGPHQVNNLNLRNISRFHVHPMFRAYLGMKEAKQKTV
jgi:hypothetical protein